MDYRGNTNTQFAQQKFRPTTLFKFVNILKAMYKNVQPDKLDKSVDLIENTFAKLFPEDDKYRWSKVLGSIVADSWFVVPSIQQASAHAGNLDYKRIVAGKYMCC